MLHEEIGNLLADAIEFLNFNELISAQVKIHPGHHVFDPNQNFVPHFIGFDIEEGADS